MKKDNYNTRLLRPGDVIDGPGGRVYIISAFEDEITVIWRLKTGAFCNPLHVQMWIYRQIIDTGEWRLYDKHLELIDH